MRILIAEDDQVLADGLCARCAARAPCVDHGNGSRGRCRAGLTNNEFDLLILDLGLPRMHGLEVLKRLRSRGSALPVLILTAADSVESASRVWTLAPTTTWPSRSALQELEARVRPRAGHGWHEQRDQARPAGSVRPGRARGHHRRQDDRAVGARTGPAGGCCCSAPAAWSAR